MHPTNSPWLAQLETRDPYRMSGEPDVDTVIVGAGIAGITTAYQLLVHTKCNVLLVDSGRIAHGATGRNAGHVVSEFERPVSDIMRAFGKEMTIQGIADIESAWGLLQEMLNMSGIDNAYDTCKGYNGFTDLSRLIEQLETYEVRQEAGMTDQPILVQADPALIAQIPERLLPYIMQVPHSAILEVLETDDTRFIALEITSIGCMNSALFCEKLAAWMLRKYADCFRIAEETPVETVILEKDSATLVTPAGPVTARHVVLCTNGFKNINIENKAGDDIHTSFGAMVQGVIGYMTGYLDEKTSPISALCYFDPEEYYLTRRPYPGTDERNGTLICLGGADNPLPDNTAFDASLDFPEDIEKRLAVEIEHTYRGMPSTARHTFLWQGLMGYTANGIRRVGFEPRNPVLLYNLGCNGVGILPSVYGGKRIAQLLSGQELPPSIFDPELGHL